MQFPGQLVQGSARFVVPVCKPMSSGRLPRWWHAPDVAQARDIAGTRCHGLNSRHANRGIHIQ
jgi:hypothetical protein